MPGSPGRPSAPVSDYVLIKKLRALRVDGYRLMAHHIEALLPATRLAIDCQATGDEHGAALALVDCRYWSARFAKIRHFNMDALGLIAVEVVKPIARAIQAWRRGEGELVFE